MKHKKLFKLFILLVAFCIGSFFASSELPEKVEAEILFSCACSGPPGGGEPPDKSTEHLPSSYIETPDNSVNAETDKNSTIQPQNPNKDAVAWFISESIKFLTSNVEKLLK